MKFLLLVAVIFALVFANTETTVIRGYQQQITASALSSRLDYFASDFFEGRETTSTFSVMKNSHPRVSRLRNGVSTKVQPQRGTKCTKGMMLTVTFCAFCASLWL
jgi:hypothetical protein